MCVSLCLTTTSNKRNKEKKGKRGGRGRRTVGREARGKERKKQRKRSRERKASRKESEVGGGGRSEEYCYNTTALCLSGLLVYHSHSVSKLAMLV